jgi:proline racemase
VGRRALSESTFSAEPSSRAFPRLLHCVDTHCEGEPTRVVVGGVLDIPGKTLLEKMHYLQHKADGLRRALLFEPRGSAPLSATLVLPPVHPDADASFIIMESASYEGMSGTNTFNTAMALLETGMIPMEEPVTHLTLEAPAGLVHVTAECSGGRCRQLTFENVPSFAVHLDAMVNVPGIGDLRVDVAYGGAWVAFVEAEPLGFTIVPAEARAIADLGEEIRPHVAAQLPITHPTIPALSHLSFVVFTAKPRDGGHARNATVVSPGRLDRSPTGTATSARLAVLAAKKQLAVDEPFINESIISTRFTARIARRARVGPYAAIVPAITGRAWITGLHQVVIRADDPLADGFTLGDTWGAGMRAGTLNDSLPSRPSRRHRDTEKAARRRKR